MIQAILFVVLFAFCGVSIAEVVFRKHTLINRIWLGLAIGLCLLTWLPSLLAFLIGFTVTAQLLASAIAFVLLCVSTVIRIINRKHWGFGSSNLGSLPWMLLVSVPILVIGASLLNTHVLYPHADGSVWVGQVTYGDLAMHLGFITSIAEQTAFPPQYSIFPGHALNYPFLCETSGASLYQLGATARQAYIISAFYAFLLVVFGVYRFFKGWLKRDGRAALATVLFFFGGGFGFFYFFDLSKSGGILQSLIDTSGNTVSQTLLDGFYNTPTNIPAIGLRWVNPIVDMLIPQRATLFGWAILFPCLYLLHGYAFERRRENLIMLGVFAGALPLIHTHSFLALGIVSAFYCINDLITTRFEKRRVLGWLLYAGIACVLAAPQLFGFSFRQASESSLVRFHLNWGNTTDSYLWFYIKNLGLLFLLMPFAFLMLSKRDRRIYLSACLIWLIAEFIEFQPNDYDNNKLLFVWYAFTCGLISKWLCVLLHKIRFAFRKRFTKADTVRTNETCITILQAGFALYFLVKIVFSEGGSVQIPAGTLFTLFVICGYLLVLSVRTFVYPQHMLRRSILLLPILFSVFWIVMTGIIWYRQYAIDEIAFTSRVMIAAFALALLGAVVSVIRRMLANEQAARKFSPGSIALTLGAYLLMFAMTVSSVMTIMRELKSEYQVYTKDEVALSEQIKAQTDADAVILANSYHWNLVTPTTGRSIVTGTSTFLFYHGIDNSQRERDVRAMFEHPEENVALFETYGVRYILVSNAERYNYDIDYAFLNSRCEVIAQTPSGTLYRVNS